MPTLVVKSGDTPELQICLGEIYAPNRPDAQGEYMKREWIQKAAHDFLRSGRMNQIDVLHNNKVVKGCSVVESYIAPDDDKVFIPGSWVVGVHIPDPSLWSEVKKGNLNGFSMEALVSRHEQDVNIEIPPIVTGKTSKSDGHEHSYFVSYDHEGNFKGGTTSMDAGHSHVILAGTHTQPATDGHSHRFSSVDNINIIG